MNETSYAHCIRVINIANAKCHIIVQKKKKIEEEKGKLTKEKSIDVAE
ncbi:MAG: hypothetical protein KAJ14_01910 [Candidatus Omnitrophica bacterium]|nr:hypothetical protein [Candidatus Omnitrophota bacterium]